MLKGRCYVEFDAVSYNGTIHEIGDDCLVKRVGRGRIAACLLLTARDETFIAVYIADVDHFSICKESTITTNGNNHEDINDLRAKWNTFVLQSNPKPARSASKKPKPKAKKLIVTEDDEEIEQVSSRTRSLDQNNSEKGHASLKRKRPSEQDEQSESFSEEVELITKKQNTARGPLLFTLHNDIEEDVSSSNNTLLLEVQRLAGVMTSFTTQAKEQLANMKHQVETLKSEVTAKFLFIEGQFTKLGASVDAIAAQNNQITKENDREKVLVIQSPQVRPEPNYYSPYNEYDTRYSTVPPRHECEPRYSTPPPRHEYEARYGTPPPRQQYNPHYSTPPPNRQFWK